MTSGVSGIYIFEYKILSSNLMVLVKICSA